MPRLMNLRKLAISLAMFAVVAFGSSAIAKADTVYNLTFNNFSQVGSLGTITTHLNGDGTMHVTVALTAGYVLHGNDALGFNAAGFSGITIQNLVATGFSSGNGGSFNGFGSRPWSIDGVNTSTARSNNVTNFSFDVDASTNFTNSDQLTDFAVQIAQLDANGATGFASSGPDVPVPEPASMLLLGTGLLGAAGIARRRFRK